MILSVRLNPGRSSVCNFICFIYDGEDTFSAWIVSKFFLRAPRWYFYSRALNVPRRCPWKCKWMHSPALYAAACMHRDARCRHNTDSRNNFPSYIAPVRDSGTTNEFMAVKLIRRAVLDTLFSRPIYQHEHVPARGTPVCDEWRAFFAGWLALCKSLKRTRFSLLYSLTCDM